jgi:hypothetical protein
VTTETIEPRPVTITDAEHMRSVADWLESQGISRHVSLVQIPRGPNGKPTVVFSSMADFRRLFRGKTARVERAHGRDRYIVTLDYVMAECNEYIPCPPLASGEIVL